MIDIMIFFNPKLGAKAKYTRPFNFRHALNFRTKENCKQFYVTFDAKKIEEFIKVYDFQAKQKIKEGLSQGTGVNMLSNSDFEITHLNLSK